MATISMPTQSLIAELDDLWAVNAARYVIAATAIGTNGFLIAIIACTAQLRQSKYNCYILVLGIADFMTGQSVSQSVPIPFISYHIFLGGNT